MATRRGIDLVLQDTDTGRELDRIYLRNADIQYLAEDLGNGYFCRKRLKFLKTLQKVGLSNGAALKEAVKRQEEGRARW